MGNRHTPYHMLIEGFAEPGCPICVIVEGAILKYLDMLLHEHVNDLEFRETLRAAGGFCNVHGWWLVTRVQGGALGSTLMYRDVLNTIRGRLSGKDAAPSSPLRRAKRSFGARPATTGACPACEIRAKDEHAFLDTFRAHCGEWRFLEAYSLSAGLCLVHLEGVMAMGIQKDELAQLLEAQGRIIDRLLHELDEFARKNDYRFTGEEIGAEGTAWQRAIEMVNGRQGIR